MSWVGSDYNSWILVTLLYSGWQQTRRIVSSTREIFPETTTPWMEWCWEPAQHREDLQPEATFDIWLLWDFSPHKQNQQSLEGNYFHDYKNLLLNFLFLKYQYSEEGNIKHKISSRRNQVSLPSIVERQEPALSLLPGSWGPYKANSFLVNRISRTSHLSAVNMRTFIVSRYIFESNVSFSL